MVAGAETAESYVAAADLERRFSAFVATHRDRARRVAWRLLGGDESAAEDVAQDAFVKAYRALGRFREDSKLETWFYRILVRQAHNHRRWRALRRPWIGASGEEAPRPWSDSRRNSGRHSFWCTWKDSRSARRRRSSGSRRAR